MRIQDTYEAFFEQEGVIEPYSINISTFSIYSNYLVAKEVIQRNFLFGSGLGTHPFSYDYYIDQLYKPEKYADNHYVNAKLNREDGSSLFIRLLSELGVFGILSFLFFIFKFYLGREYGKENTYGLFLINNAILVMLLLKLVRYGNYANLGFFFFFFLYLYSARLTKEKAL
jgi:hypothetical protein